MLNDSYLPDFGHELASCDVQLHARAVPDEELIDHIASTTGLSRGESARVVQDVLAYYREPLQDFVRRRHAHHQLYGSRNAQAFELIAEELSERLVAPPELSARQLRRIIYG